MPLGSMCANSPSLHTCCNTFIANWGVIAPLVISSSRESVRAMPILIVPDQGEFELWWRWRKASRWTPIELIISWSHEIWKECEWFVGSEDIGNTMTSSDSGGGGISKGYFQAPDKCVACPWLIKRSHEHSQVWRFGRDHYCYSYVMLQNSLLSFTTLLPSP